MLFGNVAAIVCSVIAIAAVIWVYKNEHPRNEHEDEGEED